MNGIKHWQKDDFLAIALDRAEKLNALNEEMVTEITRLITHSQASEVQLYGASERAFCAGGDVAAVATRSREVPATFFSSEYAADLSLWQCDARLTTIGHGVVMGGGLGLFAPGQRRVVSETTVAAMPEITIGFFPDVAAHYFLPKYLPPELAYFMALTGARLNGREMFELGLATHFVENRFLTPLRSQAISAEQLDQLSKECQVQTHFKVLENRFKTFKGEIAEFLNHSELEQMDLHAQNYLELGLKNWFATTMETFLTGSPVSKYVTQKLFRIPLKTDAKKALELDLKLAHWFDHHPDFKEGVRALLVDKDKNPKWAKLTSEIKKQIDELIPMDI